MDKDKLPHHLPLWHALSGPAHTYYFWVKCHPNRIFPQRNLSGNPKIDPTFSPPRNHTIWIPWPMAHLPYIGWVQVGGALALCACSTLFEFFFLAFTPFLLPLLCLVLLYILVGVYPSWCGGYVGFWAHSFSISFIPRLGIAQVRAFIFIACRAHVFFFMAVDLLAINLVVLLHCVCYSFVFPFTSYYPVGLWADVLVVSACCFINHWLKASLTHLPHIYLLWTYWPSFLSCQPVLPLYSLGFLSSFTSFLPLFYSYGSASHQFCHSSLLGLFPHLFTLFPFPPSL